MNTQDYQEDYLYSEDYESSMRDQEMVKLEAWLRAYYKGEIYE